MRSAVLFLFREVFLWGYFEAKRLGFNSLAGRHQSLLLAEWLSGCRQAVGTFEQAGMGMCSRLVANWTRLWGSVAATWGRVCPSQKS